jgi:hypothetical protein
MRPADSDPASAMDNPALTSLTNGNVPRSLPARRFICSRWGSSTNCFESFAKYKNVAFNFFAG